MKKTNKQGISLIVLVLTIVIMVILAAVIILTLNGSGILDNANEAKEASDEAVLKDAALVAYGEWQTNYHMGKETRDVDTYIADRLAQAGYTYEQYGRISTDNGIITVSEDVTIKVGEEAYTVAPGTTWTVFIASDDNTDDAFAVGADGNVEYTYEEGKTADIYYVKDGAEVYLKAADKVATVGTYLLKIAE